MCIAIPMRVIAVTPGHAVCEGRGEVRQVRTALVGDCAAGDWLLVFLDSAREHLTAERAHEVGAALDLVQAAMDGGPGTGADPGFDLPSATSAAQLAAFAGTPRHDTTP